MTDGQQTDGGNGAGITTPPPTPNVTDTTDWKAQAETWQSRYNGQQTAMNKKSAEVKSWQQKVAELQAELEGFKGTTSAELTDWQKKNQTLEQQTAEQAAKLAQYELKEKTRKLIYSDDFKDLATDFEMDEVFQFGVLAAAKEMDDAALKASLAKSLEVRKGKLAAAATAAVSGASSAAPNSGTTGAGSMSEEQAIAKVRQAKLGTPEYDLAMKQWQEARAKNR